LTTLVTSDSHAAAGEKAVSPSVAGAAYEVVALAASAGGLHALTQVLAGLPMRFAAAILIVQHLDPRHRSLLAEILGRRTLLRVKQAEEGDQVRHATVFIAAPDRHLVANSDGSLSLSSAEAVHFSRPSVDLLFTSVATSYGPRAIAVVLSGSGSDGSAGARAIKDRGGLVIAQDPKTAAFTGMPASAIRAGAVDLVLPLPEIAGALVRLVMTGEAR
jgi:two-component system chemotaxis response regulator CheB